MSNYIRLHLIGEAVGQAMMPNSGFDVEETIAIVRELVGIEAKADQRDLDALRSSLQSKIDAYDRLYNQSLEQTRVTLERAGKAELSLEESESYRAKLLEDKRWLEDELKLRPLVDGADELRKQIAQLEAELAQANENTRIAEGNRQQLETQIAELLLDKPEDKALGVTVNIKRSKPKQAQAPIVKAKRVTKPRSAPGDRLFERLSRTIMDKLEPGKVYQTRAHYHKLAEHETNSSSVWWLVDNEIKRVLGDSWQITRVGANNNYVWSPTTEAATKVDAWEPTAELIAEYKELLEAVPPLTDEELCVELGVDAGQLETIRNLVPVHIPSAPVVIERAPANPKPAPYPSYSDMGPLIPAEVSPEIQAQIDRMAALKGASK
jgi:hypothetical protein